MITRGRVRVLVGVVLTLALVVPLGAMWWHSRVSSSYDVMDMGYPDYGGGPHGHGAMTGMASTSAGTSLRSLDHTPARDADEHFDLTTRQGRFRLASGHAVDGYSVNGTSPGPTLVVHVGDLVQVRVRNANVAGGVAIHWHGVDVPNAEDGVAGITQNAIRPGHSFTYRWVAPHVGTYWYHSHQLSHDQVAGGLYGGLVVLPRTAAAGVRQVLGLAHLYDGDETLNGRTGAQRVVARAGERVLVRLANTDNGPQTAWSATPYRLVATDGRAVNRPGLVRARGVDIPAGGRVDLEVQVPTDGSATRVAVLGGPSFVIGPPGSKARTPVQPETDLDLLHYGAPAKLPFDALHPDRRFVYSLGRRPGFVNGKPGLWWSVNGHLFPDLPMFVVRKGDVVQIRISNHSGTIHPMHLHGHHAVVLSRNGRPVTGSPWWFDSLDVRDGERFTVAFVADNPGIWMDHCHDLRHAAQGLVTHLMYEGVTTPFRIGSRTGNHPE